MNRPAPNHQHWKITSAGTHFDFLNPTPAMIDRKVIAHELSMICRWNGNVDFYFTVAQHSLLVADLIPVPEWRIYGLLHDAGEAYIGDITTPLKRLVQLGDTTGNSQLNSGFNIMGLERRILNCVWEHFALPAPTKEIATAVDRADADALATEYRDVVKGTTPHWTPAGTPASRVIKFKPAIDVHCKFSEALDAYLSIHRAANGRAKGAA